MVADYSLVGKSPLRVDGLAKVTGEAIYTIDIQLTGMLFGKIKRSPYPFAKVLSINTDRALRLPGVKAVITAWDVVQFPFGPHIPDELPLADKLGIDPIGLILKNCVQKGDLTVHGWVLKSLLKN